jgi:hypothetical protein
VAGAESDSHPSIKDRVVSALEHQISGWPHRSAQIWIVWFNYEQILQRQIYMITADGGANDP